MTELSVIIPIYKVESYLDQCVNSVIDQNITACEIILVDDGSTDNSSAISDAYALKDEKICVIHKPNGGLSSARNVGINFSRGNHIMFMDSDDWWNRYVNVNSVLNEARNKENVEMFLFSSLDYVEGSGIYKRQEHNKFRNISTDSAVDYYHSLLENGNLEVSACTKILKTAFVKNNKLFFREGLTGEDNEWMIRLLRKLQTVMIIDEPIYMCRGHRIGSITATIGKKNIIDLLSIIESSIEYYESSTSDLLMLEYELCFCSYLWFCALGLCSDLTLAERYELKPLFMKTKSVCAYSNSPKTKLANKCLKLFGYNKTLYILGKYIALKEKYSINKRKIDI